jgi:hypothetical protein
MASLKEGLRVGEMFIAFIFVSHLVKRIGWVKWILIFTLIMGVFYGLWGMKGLANLKDLGSSVSTHFFVNPNQIAMYLDLSFPLSVAFFFYSKNVKWKILCALCILAIGITLYLTLSRSSWVSNSCALVFLILALYHKKTGGNSSVRILKGTYSFSFIGMIILFFCFLFLVSFAPGVTEFLLKRAESELPTALSHRFYGFATGYRIIEDFPFLGIGGGIFTRLASFYYLPYTPKDVQDLFVTVHFHNHYIMVAVENGLLTLFAFLLFLYSAGKDILSSLFIIKDERYWLLAGTGGSVLSWAVHNMMDAGIPFIGMQWGILLGLGVAMTKMNLTVELNRPAGNTSRPL